MPKKCHEEDVEVSIWKPEVKTGSDFMDLIIYIKNQLPVSPPVFLDFYAFQWKN